MHSQLIYTCAAHHLTCLTCTTTLLAVDKQLSRQTVCPVCRKPGAPIFNASLTHFLTTFLENSYMRCSYASVGCEEVLRDRELRLHNAICGYRFVRCAQDFVFAAGNCGWKGQANKLEHHVRSRQNSECGEILTSEPGGRYAVCLRRGRRSFTTRRKKDFGPFYMVSGEKTVFVVSVTQLHDRSGYLVTPRVLTLPATGAFMHLCVNFPGGRTKSYKCPVNNWATSFPQSLPQSVMLSAEMVSQCSNTDKVFTFSAWLATN